MDTLNNCIQEYAIQHTIWILMYLKKNMPRLYV